MNRNNIRLEIFFVRNMVDVNNLKNGRKPVKLQKEIPTGCAGKGREKDGLKITENNFM